MRARTAAGRRCTADDDRPGPTRSSGPDRVELRSRLPELIDDIPAAPPRQALILRYSLLMLAPFFSLAMAAPARQTAFRRAAVAHCSFVGRRPRSS